ncbi:hypothetical protein ACFFWC_14070 [Plantactinospora siamensis]|uniref:Uncharacterized protein n=1 Tax=Plantactinospora siamensis TaxID=555372 RepID=A0ABV6P1B9_9ACTN
MKRLAVLLIGLSMAICGIAGFFDDTVECGGQTMESGDKCVTYRDGTSTTRTVAEERSSGHFTDGLLAAIGSVLVLGTGITFLGKAVPEADSVRSRAELAQSQGWDFVERDASALDGIRGLPHFHRDTVPYNVLRGTMDGMRFTVFDYETSVINDREPNTAWVVRLPPSIPAGFAEWAGRQAPLWSRPNNMVYPLDTVLVDIGSGVHRSVGDQVLRQVKGLVEIVHRFERHAAKRAGG